MTITLTREEAQQVLDALEKLANETPTTHVRVGKAISEGKEHVALWFDDSTDPLQQALYLNATKPEKLKPLLAFFRARLSAPEPEPVAWADQHDIDREGHDFHVSRQKPAKDGVPLYTASPQAEPEPVAWFSKRPDNTLAIKIVGKPTEGNWEPLYTTPPQREWQGLTDDERTYLAWESNNGPHCVAMTEAKLKEKNT